MKIVLRRKNNKKKCKQYSRKRTISSSISNILSSEDIFSSPQITKVSDLILIKNDENTMPANNKNTKKVNIVDDEDDDNIFENNTSYDCVYEIIADPHINKVPEQIINVMKLNGQLMFLIKWKDLSEANIFPAKEVNLLWPKIVIAFYETIQKWSNP